MCHAALLLSWVTLLPSRSSNSPERGFYLLPANKLYQGSNTDPTFPSLLFLLYLIQQTATQSANKGETRFPSIPSSGNRGRDCSSHSLLLWLLALSMAARLLTRAWPGFQKQPFSTVRGSIFKYAPWYSKEPRVGAKRAAHCQHVNTTHMNGGSTWCKV